MFVEKNVFMIICHKNVSQVIRLAKSCISDTSDVIVHADSLMAAEEYAVLEEFSRNHSGVYLTDRRMHGELDKASLVHITMEMVHKAFDIQQQKGEHYRYFCLLSGQDYLIKPLSYICDELKRNYPKPYIDCTPYDKNGWMYKKLRWNVLTNKIRLKIDAFFKNQHRHPIRVALMVILLLLSKSMHIIMPDLYHQIRKNADVYGGSAWWILPDIAIDYIYRRYSDSDKLVELLLQAITPEELFFQTLAMQSSVKDDIEVNGKDAVAQNCKTWAYFYDDDKPPVNHPYTFTINEFEKLKKSNCWIARKFDQDVDAEILDMLDEHIQNRV